MRGLLAQRQLRTVNVIASHGHDDDDLACAEFIQDQIQDTGRLDPATVVQRIRNSRPAAKFLVQPPGEFEPRDLDFCTAAQPSDFVMEVDRTAAVPAIRRREVAMLAAS